MFKINNRNMRRSGTFIVNFETYFTPCSSVSIVNFEHVNAGWNTCRSCSDAYLKGRKNCERKKSKINKCE